MGNFETKHSPYYAITDEISDDNGKTPIKKPDNQHSFWVIKRASFESDNKNSSLFEFNNSSQKLQLNDSKGRSNNKQLALALNQIKTLKTLRHPNVVKYFYSEEPPPSQQQSHSYSAQANLKCLLITEFIRPVNLFIETCNYEQVMHGIFGITNAIHFLHDKVKMSHNNLTENCIYVNCKQVWKLNDFELALSFDKLNSENLKEIYELKQRNAITPEEEANFKDNGTGVKLDLNKVYKEAPHSIDAYGWALTILNILPNNQFKSFKSFFGDDPSPINHSNNDEASNSNEQLELYLSTDPRERPSLSSALEIKLFDLYKTNTDENSSEAQLFKIDNLEDLEKNFTKLMEYLEHVEPSMVNEKLIDFLLAPFMFFSERVRKQIFPLLFIPKEFYIGEENFQSKIDFKNFYFSIFQKFVGDKCIENEMTMGISIEPFMDLVKYKTFVIPRVLNLMTMHSTQIRLVLLEYFPFYISYVNDNESLHYEILPELLLGLKDKNDELVSQTFACLSILVKILGSEIVVGKHASSEKTSFFSDNLPKSISIDFEKELASTNESNDKNGVKNNPKRNQIPKNKSAEFKQNSKPNKFRENLGFSLNEKAKFSSATSLDQEMMTNSVQASETKLISDSMIALHDELEENGEIISNSSSNIINFGGGGRYQNGQTIENKSNDSRLEKSESNKLNDDGWSNDFGWNQEPENEFLSPNEESASVVSLAGSSDLLMPQLDDVKIKINHSLRNLVTPNTSQNNKIGSEYDIKSIVIKKLVEHDPIDDFFNDMQPTIVKKTTMNNLNNGYERLKEKGSNSLNSSFKKNVSLEPVASNDAEASWECEEIDLNEV